MDVRFRKIHIREALNTDARLLCLWWNNGKVMEHAGFPKGLETTEEKVALLVKYLRGLNNQLNIPQCIGHYGLDSYPCEKGFVPEEVFLERLPEIAANAISDACTGSNPRIPTQEEMEKLFKCVYYDTDVNF